MRKMQKVLRPSVQINHFLFSLFFYFLLFFLCFLSTILYVSATIGPARWRRVAYYKRKIIVLFCLFVGSRFWCWISSLHFDEYLYWSLDSQPGPTVARKSNTLTRQLFHLQIFSEVRELSYLIVTHIDVRKFWLCVRRDCKM